MELLLEGKTALVTGGSSGIGFACALGLIGEGVDVAIVARDPERLAAAGSALEASARRRARERPARVVTVSADLTRADDVTRSVREATQALGRIDILVNSAGSAVGGSFATLADDAYVDAWTLKLLGYLRMVRAVVPAMIERRDGRIVNIVGGAGRTPGPTFLAGSTVNAAVLNFTRGISKELAEHNVRINAISPGTTATERAERRSQQDAAISGRTLDEVKAERVERVPLKRMVDPSEIAAMTLLLVSDRVASMTGAEVLIDAGATPGV
jgi:NAD(P)-dependent dehydrogenase (short-subunit alcohol dehydrogenase family)